MASSHRIMRQLSLGGMILVLSCADLHAQLPPVELLAGQQTPVTAPPLPPLPKAPGTPTPPGPPVKTVPPPAAAVIAPAPATSAGSGTTIPSLLFKRDEMEKLRKALGIYEQSKLYSQQLKKEKETNEEDEDFLSKLEESQKSTQSSVPQALKEVWPSMTVNSIMYHSENDWVVWINGKKIESSMPTDIALEITKVEPDRITLAWAPGTQLRAVQEKIGKMPKEKTQWIGFDRVKNRYVVVLYPNQSFITESMEIIEGKPAPASAAVSAKSPAGMPPGAKSNEAETMSATEAVKEAGQSVAKESPVLMAPTAPATKPPADIPPPPGTKHDEAAPAAQAPAGK